MRKKLKRLKLKNKIILLTLKEQNVSSLSLFKT